MQQNQSNLESDNSQRNNRLLRIVIAHLLIVGGFFIATFFWGNFA